MTEPTSAQPSFTQNLWDLDEATLIQRFIVAKQAGDSQTALAILHAKATLAAQAAADETRRMALQTKRLALAIIVLAAATVALVIITVWGAL